MNKWELTDGELDEVREGISYFKNGSPIRITDRLQLFPRAVVKSSNRKLVEWLDSQYGCKNPEDMAHPWLLISPEDWQKLLKGVGIESARTSKNS